MDGQKYANYCLILLELRHCYRLVLNIAPLPHHWSCLSRKRHNYADSYFESWELKRIFRRENLEYFSPIIFFRQLYLKLKHSVKYGLIHIPYLKALQETLRVLKPGGKFVFTDPMQSETATYDQLKPVYDRLRSKNFATPQWYKETGARVGFKV